MKRRDELPDPVDAIDNWNKASAVARVLRKVLTRRGAISPVGWGSRRNNFVSYKSETANHFPSSDMADEIRLVRS